MQRRIKVSIVDDEKSYRQVLKQTMEKDLRISIFGEYAYGIDFINSLNSPFKPDVCLLDIKLVGEMSGVDCAKILKKVAPNIHIIFLTAYPDSETMLEAKQLKADYIEKGTLGEVLIDKIVTSVERDDQLLSLQQKTYTKYCKKTIELSNRLDNAQSKVQSLTNNQKKVLILKQKGKTINEIAKTLNMNPNTVTSHIERGLSKLKLPFILEYIEL